MHGAKRTRFGRTAIIGALAMGASGCAGIERFAPPGIVKYEDLAKGQPMNEQIKARVAGADAGKSAFPNLSKTPQAAPETLPADEQTELKAILKEARSTLNNAATADRAAIDEDDGGQGLIAARDALKVLVEADDARARDERGLPRRTPAQP